MDAWLVLGGVSAFFVSSIHSVLGERLIFSRMRGTSVVPTEGGPVLRERHVRILWATWHIVSLFGIAMAAILVRIALFTHENIVAFSLAAISLSMGASGLLVLYATRGMHPGWFGLFVVCVAAWMGEAVSAPFLHLGQLKCE